MSEVDEFEDMEEEKPKGTLQVWNMTDGFPATQEWFKTLKEAKQFIKEFRQRFRDTQGYYLTSDCERIDPDDIKLEIMGKYREGGVWKEL